MNWKKKKNQLEPTKWQGKKYIKMPVDDMFPLLILGIVLEIKSLINLMVKAVGLQIQGKSVEEIRETFQIEDPKKNCRRMKCLGLHMRQKIKDFH